MGGDGVVVWQGDMGAGLNDLTLIWGWGGEKERGYSLPQYLQYGESMTIAYIKE